MLTINISWEFFIGILGTLIALTYYANGRLTRLETNFDWLADAVRDLTIKVENVSAKAFEIGSPISLTATGEPLLRDSGLKYDIDYNKDELTRRLCPRMPIGLYNSQRNSVALVDPNCPYDPVAPPLD